MRLRLEHYPTILNHLTRWGDLAPSDGSIWSDNAPVRILTRFLAAVAVIFAATGAGLAHFTDDIVVAGCTDIDLHPDPVAVIEPCTTLIEGGTLKGNELAAALRHRGDAYFRTKQYDKAYDAYDSALDVQPFYPRALWNRSNLNSVHGRFAARIRDLEQALSIDPDHPLILESVGMAFSYAGQIGKAIDYYSRALKADPTMLRVTFNRARAYLMINERRQALADLDHILEIDHDEVNRNFIVSRNDGFSLYGEVLSVRADVLREMRRYDLAQRDLDLLVILYPNNPRSYRYRGQFWTATGDTVKAVSDFTRAIELNPRDTANFRARAHVFRAQNQHAAALEDLTLAIEIAPADGRNYLDRAQLYKQLRQQDLALTDYERAFALDGELLKVHLSSLMEFGYYSGPRLSFVNDKIRNGLIACVVDPRC